MAYWAALTLLSCAVGFWLATRYNLDSKVGVTLGLSFSILFTSGLYREVRRYDAPLKLVLVVFVVLLCVTFLLLLERHTLVAWLKLACVTFLVSFLSHQMGTNPAYLGKAQLALDLISETTGVEAPDISAIVASAENRVAALSRSLPGGPSTLVEVRRETELLNAQGGVSQKVRAGTWVLLRGETLEDQEKRLLEVEILDERGRMTDVGYLDESDFGLKVIVPPSGENP